MNVHEHVLPGTTRFGSGSVTKTCRGPLTQRNAFSHCTAQRDVTNISSPCNAVSTQHILLESASNISREVKRSVRSMMHSNKL
jgi:hypothetical protein